MLSQSAVDAPIPVGEGASRWIPASLNRRILAAAVTVASLTLVVKGASMIRDLTVAYLFGIHDEVDAFLIALVLPSFALNIVTTSLTASFVPTLVEVRERQGQERANRLLATVLALGIAVLLAITGGLALSFPTLLPGLASNFPPAKQAMTQAMFVWLLPTVAVSGLAAIWTGVLNADKRFTLGAAAPVAIPALSFIAVLAGGRTYGVTALAAGSLVGHVATAAVLGYALHRSGWTVVPRWHGVTSDLRRVLEQCWPAVAGAVLMGATGLVEGALASSLDAGSVSALNYGNRVVGLIAALLTMSLGTAVLPHFAHIAAAGEWRTLRGTLRTWIRAIVVLTVPLAIVLVLGSHLIVAITFEHGAFTPADTARVSLVQSLAALQVPFFAVGILLARLLAVLRRNGALLVGNLISLPLHIGLSLFLMPGFGVAAIALSTSVMYTVSCAYLAIVVWRALPQESAGTAHA